MASGRYLPWMKRTIVTVLALAALAAQLAGCLQAREPRQEGVMGSTAAGATETMVLGGGCFWCLEAVFERIDGVVEVVSGYAGGRKADPTTRRSARAPRGTRRSCR